MEQGTVQAGTVRPVGARQTKNIIAGWDGPPMRAVLLLGRPDVILEYPSMYSPTGWIGKLRLKKGLGERWRGEVDRWRVGEFPEYMGLALDHFGTLHLLSLERGSFILAQVKDELKQWPISDVKVTIKSNGCMWRAVEISDDTESYMVIAPSIFRARRAALRLISESAGADWASSGEHFR
jgi:hypothetical protein